LFCHLPFAIHHQAGIVQRPALERLPQARAGLLLGCGGRIDLFAISRAGKKQLQTEPDNWTRGAAIVARSWPDPALLAPDSQLTALADLD
jgi:hypothetical protein